MNNSKIKYLSVCSGIEAATTAWHGLGWEPVGFSEIEPFPSAVLAYHYPNVKNYGDMNNYKEWEIGEFNLLVGGTPCQSFSVAGLRKGLDDPRGNLMLTYGAIANHFKPRWIVWENVPGVLSSNKGRDFGTFLGMLAELGYGFAYRVLDSQYVRVESHRRAVPQRRRRVFVVGYLGDWRRAAAVLFESESLSRYTPPSRKAGEGITHDIAPSITASGRGTERTGDTRGQDAVIPVVQPYTVGNCLTQRMHKGINSTLDEGQTPVISAFAQNSKDEVREMEVSGALAAEPGMKQQSFLQQGYRVRRLTPRECERLQGFPDDWTRIPWRGKTADKCPDGPRYKAIGNSMAVNVMKWIGSRIDKVNNEGFTS